MTVWISDHGEKDLLAYRLPTRQDAEAAGEDASLERVRDEDFTELSNASNNSPRGIWSDGDAMYVADESDEKAYTYNMPDAIDARLASLTLEGVATPACTLISAQRAVPAPPAPESSTGSQAPPPGSESGSLLGQSAGRR